MILKPGHDIAEVAGTLPELKPLYLKLSENYFVVSNILRQRRWPAALGGSEVDEIFTFKDAR